MQLRWLHEPCWSLVVSQSGCNHRFWGDIPAKKTLRAGCFALKPIFGTIGALFRANRVQFGKSGRTLKAFRGERSEGVLDQSLTKFHSSTVCRVLNLVVDPVGGKLHMEAGLATTSGVEDMRSWNKRECVQDN